MSRRINEIVRYDVPKLPGIDLERWGKVKIYKTPTKNKPNRIHVGIPNRLRLNPWVHVLKFTSIEILPPPTGFADLARIPKTEFKGFISADKNMDELSSGWDPNTWFEITYNTCPPNGHTWKKKTIYESVSLPNGYIPVEDTSEWIIYNYNKCWEKSDKNFKLLTGVSPQPLAVNPISRSPKSPISLTSNIAANISRTLPSFQEQSSLQPALQSTIIGPATLKLVSKFPKQMRYSISRKGNDIICKHSAQITDLILYYRLANSDVVRWEFLGNITNDTTISINELEGKNIIRAIPRIGGEVLSGFKDIEIKRPIDVSIEYTYIQISKTSFQFKITGKLPEEINRVKIFENSYCVKDISLRPNSAGNIDETFIVKNLSDVYKSKLEIKYYLNNAYHSREFLELYRYTGKLPIGLRVSKGEEENFEISITDPNKILYKPKTNIGAFDGIDWEKAVQSQRYMAKLMIRRHQGNEVEEYGAFDINTTDGDDPKFLETPPFVINETFNRIVKKGNSVIFNFKDSHQFRNMQGISSPVPNEPMSFEFRLQIWTCGIEHCLRTDQEYSFLKEDSVVVKDERTLYKYNYNVWQQEHPKRKYRGVIPLPVSKKSYKEHELYGTSSVGVIVAATPSPEVKTTNVNIEERFWKVLYSFNKKDNFIETFPYYSFTVNVPTTTIENTSHIEISVLQGGEKKLLGKYHPSAKIRIVDFLGYYLATKEQMKQTNFVKAIPKPFSIATKPSFSFESPNSKVRVFDNQETYEIPTAVADTPAQIRAIESASVRMSNAMAMKIKENNIKYVIKLFLNDGTHTSTTIFAKISDVPEAEPEEENNQNIVFGNRLIKPDNFNILPGLANNMVKAISDAPIKKSKNLGKLL